MLDLKIRRVVRRGRQSFDSRVSRRQSKRSVKRQESSRVQRGKGTKGCAKETRVFGGEGVQWCVYQRGNSYILAARRTTEETTKFGREGNKGYSEWEGK